MRGSAEPGASPFIGVGVYLMPAIVIPRPFVHTAIGGRMAWMAAPIARPLVGVELCAASRNVIGNEVRHVRVPA
jgi:hypothetical protein